MKARESKSQKFINVFELVLSDVVDDTDNLSHMSGDLDMSSTTITEKEQPINPNRLKALKKWKEVYDKEKYPDDGKPEIEF